jgi:ABC-type multidrug transport system permease subunit
MASNAKSALVAGVIAFVIYTVIAVLTGTGFGADVGVGLMFLIVTALITFISTPGVTAIRKNKTPA